MRLSSHTHPMYHRTWFDERWHNERFSPRVAVAR